MKKILFTIAIVLTMTFNASAQMDSFIGPDYSNNIDRTGDIMPLLPIFGVGAYDGDQSATPLGSGLLIFTALGVGYAMKKRKDKR